MDKDPALRWDKIESTLDTIIKLFNDNDFNLLEKEIIGTSIYTMVMKDLIVTKIMHRVDESMKKQMDSENKNVKAGVYG